MLEMINVSYAYKSKKEIVHVLDKVTYRFEIGEMYGIFGPSGSGKTTCLSLLAGLEKPDEGEILLDGENIQDIGGRKLRQNSISLVFQDYQLFDYMTSLENVMVAAQISLPDVPKKELIKMCRDSLVMVGLDDSQITRKVTELSGGQQQRIAIARALVNEPEILMLDEPLGALDLKMRKEMQIELKNMHDQLGITFIYVTHDQEEALTMSDKIVVLSEGKIQQIGTPEDIYNEPKNAFVADFIGESNIFKGIMTGHMKVRF